MVLDPHAQGIDQNGDHNPSSEVLAVHNLSECIAHQPPEADNVCCRFPQLKVLLFGLPAVPPVSVVKVLGELIHAIAVRVPRGFIALRAALWLVCQGLDTVRATLGFQCQSGRVHGIAGDAQVTSRQLAGELCCSQVRKVRWRHWDKKKEVGAKIIVAVINDIK